MQLDYVQLYEQSCKILLQCKMNFFQQTEIILCIR